MNIYDVLTPEDITKLGHFGDIITPGDRNPSEDEGKVYAYESKLVVDRETGRSLSPDEFRYILEESLTENLLEISTSL